MSNRDNFNSGFLLGSLIGGVVGGIIGVIVADRANRLDSEVEETGANPGQDLPRRKANRRQLRPSEPEERLEVARQSLDDKILDLDRAIDAVRSSLSSVAAPDLINNANNLPESEPPTR